MAWGPITMRALKGALILTLWLTCVSAFWFPFLREAVPEPPPLSLVREHLPDLSLGWLANTGLWLLRVVGLYVIVKYGVLSEESEGENAPVLRSSDAPAEWNRNQSAAPREDQMVHTLNQLEIELVQFVTKVRGLKSAVTTGSELQDRSWADAQDKFTIYEIWGDEEDG